MFSTGPPGEENLRASPDVLPSYLDEENIAQHSASTEGASSMKLVRPSKGQLCTL